MAYQQKLRMQMDDIIQLKKINKDILSARGIDLVDIVDNRYPECGKGDICSYCDIDLLPYLHGYNPHNRTIDHVIPKIDFKYIDNLDYTFMHEDNVVLSCPTCNSAKGNRPLSLFLAKLEDPINADQSPEYRFYQFRRWAEKHFLRPDEINKYSEAYKLKISHDDCWFVMGQYRAIKRINKTPLHIFFYEANVGPVPASCELKSICNEGLSCVNYNHFRLEHVDSAARLEKVFEPFKQMLQAHDHESFKIGAGKDWNTCVDLVSQMCFYNFDNPDVRTRKFMLTLSHYANMGYTQEMLRTVFIGHESSPPFIKWLDECISIGLKYLKHFGSPDVYPKEARWKR